MPRRGKAILPVAIATLVSLSAQVSCRAEQSFVSGRIQSQGRSTALSAGQLAFVSDWMRRHPHWRMNLATPPMSSVNVSMDTETQHAAADLQLWSADRYPGWKDAILLEGPKGPVGLQSFSSAADRAAFLKAVGLPP